MNHPRRSGVGDTPWTAAAVEALPRIAIVAPNLDILGGQGIQARDLAAALRRDGFEVFFIDVNPRFPRGLRWLRRVPVARTLLNQCLYAFGLLRLRRADVVHVFSASYWSFLLAPVPAMLAARTFRKRVILNYHSGEAEDHLSNWGRRVHPFLQLADRIVVPSTYLQTVFERHGYAARVVPNIIDLSSFPWRERRPLRPQLLSCRNLEAHYRVEDVIDAFALLRERVPDATLRVAGYGSEAQRLRQRVADQGLGGVEFLGRVEPEAIARLYADTDVFLNASVIDNQPISILEAFAAGLAVVSTPTGDIPWMLDQGRLGVLVPPRNPAALAQAVIDLLASPDRAEEMAREARDAVRRFSWERVRPLWLDVYGTECSVDHPVSARNDHGESDETPAAV